MLRKEFQEVLKQSLVYIALCVAIPLVLKVVLWKEIGSYFDVFFLLYQYSLLLFSIFMGLSLFLPDRNQRAEDYVYSLPYSRARVLMMKAVPRLAAVVIFYLLFLVLYLGVGREVIMSSTFFSITWLYWLLFGISISFSASGDSYMKVGGIALLGTIIFLQLFYFSLQLAFLLKGVRPPSISRGILGLLTINFSRSLGPFLVVCACLFIPYILSFFLAFKKWGTYSKENYNKGYFKLFLPLIAVGFILSSLYVSTLIVERYHAYYLTSKHQLIETHGFSTGMIDTNGEVKLKYSEGSFRAVFEDDEYVYGMHISGEPAPVVRIHKENHTVDTLLEVTRPRRFGYCSYGIRMFKHILVVPEYYKTPALQKFVFIDTRSKAVKKIATYDFLSSHYFNPHIFGADIDPASGKMFWLIASERSNHFPIMKLWEDGEAENLGIMSRTFPVYVNHILITTGKELVLRKFTDTGPEVIRKIPGNKTFPYPYSRVDLNPTSFKEIYCFQGKRRGGKDYFRLNLETLEISPVFTVPEKPGQWIYIDAGEVYKIDFDKDEKEPDIRIRRYYLNKIYRLEGDKFRLLKEFPAYENPQEGDRFWMSNNGVVIKYNNKLSLYSLPGMKQLEFKNKK